MTGMIRLGPARLILLNSGKFDFAEVDLNAPLHLVGPNNVGKTSLIAVLQFLYLDDQRHMHFSRDLPATRRYYFPDPRSYILFECLTPTGFQTLAAHGLGPLHGFEFERFAYQGRFEWGDYVDAERRVRPAEEIEASLAARGFARLEPKHIRAALTGVGDSKNVDLGLVPLRNRNHYARFRTLFRNLLRLSHLRQQELKELLLDVFESDFRHRSISLSRHYAEHLERIRRDANEVQDLRALRGEIENLLEHHARREACRARLPALWRRLGLKAEERRADLDAERQRLADATARIETELADVQKGQRAAQGRLADLSGDRAVLDHRLADLAQQAAALDGFVREWAEARKADLEGEMRRLAARLACAEAEPVERVARRIHERTGRIDALNRRLADVEHAAGTVLRRECADPVLRDAFRILNPELLGLPVNRDRPGVRVASVDDAARVARQCAAECREGRFRHGAIEIDLEPLAPPDLDRFTDPESIRSDLRALSSEQQRDEDALAAARDLDATRRRERECRTELDALQRKLYDHDRLVEATRQEPVWRRDLARLAEQEEFCAAEIERLGAQRDTLNARRRELADDRRANQERRDGLEAGLRNLERPSPDWPFVEADPEPGELEDLIERYRRLRDDEARQSERVRELILILEKGTYSRYAGQDEGVAIERLREQMECLPEKEKAVQDLWTGIAVDLKKAFKDLGADLDTLKSDVEDLNRRLGQVSISNLRRLRLLVEERPDWAHRIREVTEAEEMPLFADFASSRKAMEELGRLLSAHPEVNLDELFDLHFEVTLTDGQERRYPHLDNIESNGTTIAIKVLVNLMLLNGLLAHGKAQIPFYLDEASSLDRDNLGSIVDAAEQMGFVAVLASPDALEVARTVYYVEEQPNGRVVLDPTARVDLMRTAACANPGPGGP